MKISKQNLKNAKLLSMFAGLVIVIASIFLLMVLIKSIFILTIDQTFILFSAIYRLSGAIISFTYVTPIDYIWNAIPFIEDGLVTYKILLKVFVPPMAIMALCSFPINHYRTLRRRINQLESKISDEEYLALRRSEQGLIKKGDGSSYVILNESVNQESWHETWWGVIVIGVLIALIIAVLGIK